MGKMINKKANSMLLFGMLILLIFSLFYFVDLDGIIPEKTNEQKQQEARASFLRWNANENKFCQSTNKILNDTYNINRCRMVSCQNITGLYTYKFCNEKDNDGSFGGGLIVGYLLFG